MFCKHCGVQLSQDARFCPNCGGVLDAPAQETYRAQAPYQAQDTGTQPPYSQQPSPNTQQPFAQQPAPATPQPFAQQPAPATPQPFAQQPAPDTQQPFAQQPAPNTQQPFAQQPATGVEPQPFAQQPAPSTQQPTPNTQQPFAQQPAPGVEPQPYSQQLAPGMEPQPFAQQPAPGVEPQPFAPGIGQQPFAQQPTPNTQQPFAQQPATGVEPQPFAPGMGQQTYVLPPAVQQPAPGMANMPFPTSAQQMYYPGAQPAPAPAPKKRGSKVLLGCGIAAGIVVLLGVLIVAAAVLLSGGFGEPEQPVVAPTGGSVSAPTATPTHIPTPTRVPSPTGASSTAFTFPSPRPTIAPPDVAREAYTDMLGGGQDVFTLMVYICGSDLESDGGYASEDIAEMLAATPADRLNIIVQTGGAYYWDDPRIDGGSVQRWEVDNGSLELLDDLGRTPMITPGALADFISFCAEEYPASRYALIMWDHGGGSVYGFGYDEMYPDDVLTLDAIDTALASSGVKFDFVGFDACLMGSLEAAYMLERHADYMIASEEYEPGNGWYYTPWLDALAADTSMGTARLGALIVDSFIDQNSAEDTLSVVYLPEVPRVAALLGEYLQGASEVLASQQFAAISSSRARCREFGEGEYDMVDIASFASTSALDGADGLIAAVQSAVKYRNACTLSGVNGLSMYFPYSDLDGYSQARSVFNGIGYGGAAAEFYDSFVNILARGQESSSGSSLMDMLSDSTSDETDYSYYDWYDSYYYDYGEDYFSDYSIDYDELEIIWSDEYETWYLPLTDSDWEMLTAVETQILVDDGEGYIDLGSDQLWTEDDYGNLLFEYDNTWVAIDGLVVPYYAEETIPNDDGSYSFTGSVPALLNDSEYIDIILRWDGDSGGYIAGYRTEKDQTFTAAKGLRQLAWGDEVQFICDYYTYDMEYDDSYYYGDPITIGQYLPEVTYEDVGDGDVLMCYLLIDIYQNYSWTEYVTFSLYN